MVGITGRVGGFTPPPRILQREPRRGELFDAVVGGRKPFAERGEVTQFGILQCETTVICEPPRSSTVGILMRRASLA